MKNLFNFKHFRGDFFGGITAGIVALPLALAFGVSSGLGPTAGLYGAIFISFFAALFGGTNTQISGPTAPMTAVSMLVVAGIIGSYDGDLSEALPIILAVFLLGGLIQIVLGILALGEYIKYIPYPVVSGFMTAIGLIILVTQILPAVGFYPKEDAELVSRFRAQAQEVILESILDEEAGEGILVLEDFEETIKKAEDVEEEQILLESKTLAADYAGGVIGSIRVLPYAVKGIVLLELLLALGTILIIYGFKRITTAVPSTLVALFIMSGIAVAFKLDYRPIEEIPNGLPLPNIDIFTKFSLGSITPYIYSAITLAFLGSIDSLLTSVVADNMTKTKHNPNKELVGQGIGNSIAAIFGGIPGAGATIRTVVNIRAGGKTRLSGMIAGLLLLLILLALGPLASKIPAAVLAGILITVGIGVIDYKGLKAIPKMPFPEVLVLLLVMILSAVWNLVFAVGIGLILASLMFMKKIGDLSEKQSIVEPLTRSKAWPDERNLPEEIRDKIFIKHIRGPLFFGSTSYFQELVKQIPDDTSCVFIRMDRMQYIDQSGLFAMEDVLSELNEKNKNVLLTGLGDQPRSMMETIGIIPILVPKERVFKTFKQGIAWMENNLQNDNK